MTQDATTLTEVHFAHCGQGDYPTTCKYGEDETCPALSTPIAALAAARPDGEREAVVRWLRGEMQEQWSGSNHAKNALDDAADAIEQGQHRQEQSRG